MIVMRVGVIGINHKSADLELREEISKICAQCFGKWVINDPLVILSTCNRTEIYFSSEDLPQTHSLLLNILRQDLALPFEHKIYSYFGKDCFFHLASVTSGLDSALIGETEIQGQVKRAYEKAALYSSLPRDIHYLFQKSLKIGKELRMHCTFDHMMPTLEEAIFHSASLFLGPLHQKKILLIGYSEINERIYKSFNTKDLNLTFCNRTTDKLLAKFHSESILPWEEWGKWQEYDLIIFGTKSSQYILRADHLGLLRTKKLIIDVSVPRNVDPRVGRHSFIKLLNLDQLMRGIDRKRKAKAEERALQGKTMLAQLVERQMTLFTTKNSHIPLLEVI